LLLGLKTKLLQLLQLLLVLSYECAPRTLRHGM
jgi:hypothetical protein